MKEIHEERQKAEEGRREGQTGRQRRNIDTAKDREAQERKQYTISKTT